MSWRTIPGVLLKLAHYIGILKTLRYRETIKWVAPYWGLLRSVSPAIFAANPEKFWKNSKCQIFICLYRIRSYSSTKIGTVGSQHTLQPNIAFEFQNYSIYDSQLFFSLRTSYWILVILNWSPYILNMTVFSVLK